VVRKYWARSVWGVVGGQADVAMFRRMWWYVCVNLASTALGLSHDRPVKAQGRAPSAAKCCC
jgi:hypothetical protein